MITHIGFVTVSVPVPEREENISTQLIRWILGVTYTAKQSGFFLKISKEIGKAWRKSLTRAKRESLTRPTGV